MVIIGDRGLSDALLAELDRVLTDHELIKIRINHERGERASIADALCEHASAEVVQRIGKTVTLYRSNPEAKPNLSNVMRFT